MKKGTIYPQTYIFNSYFMELLMRAEEEFEWNKPLSFLRKNNIDLLSFEVVFIPINLNKRHWSFIALYSEENTTVINYYDSLLDEFNEDAIFKYLIPI